MRHRRLVPGPDLVVVSGGTAGIVGAKTAAGLGADVVLVERGEPGGDCLWTGCVRSKTLLSAAQAFAGSSPTRPLPSAWISASTSAR